MKLAVCVAALAAFTTEAAAQECSQIRFARGTSGTTITGTIQPEQILCYRLDVAVGQDASLSITGSAPDVAFTIVDEVDNQTEWDFMTRQNSYQIMVYTTFRTATPETFSLQVGVE